MTTVADRLAAAALSGAASGSRTFTGLAALTLATPPNAGDAPTQPDRTLAKPAAKILITLGAVQELVLDKLPMTPSRLEPIALAGRAVAAGLCGLIVARRRAAPATAPSEPATAAIASEIGTNTPGETPTWLPVVAAAAAVGTSYLGSAWRGWCTDRLGRDWVGAVLEDLAAIGFATTAARVGSGAPRNTSLST